MSLAMKGSLVTSIETSQDVMLLTNKTGECDVKLYFEGKKYAGNRLEISLSNLIAIVAVALMPKNIISV